MPSAALSFFQVVTLLGSALTVLKLLTSGLYRRYRIFFAYFVFRIPYVACSLILARSHSGPPRHQGVNSNAYFQLFFWSEPLLMLFYILVVVELYGLVLEQYKGLYTLGRWAMYASVVIAVTVSMLTLLPKIAPSTPEPSKKLMYEIGAERGVDLSLVIFILLIVLFLSRYPVPLSRNVVVHTAIYSVFFLSDTLVLLLRTVMGKRVNSTASLLLTGLTSACSVAWWLLLSAKGEQVQVSVPHLGPGSEERILQQLDSLNATLLKVSGQK
jgi:hypothetical protein